MRQRSFEFICHLCVVFFFGKVLTNFKGLKDHLRWVHGENDSIFVCDTCGKGFPLKSHLMRHIQGVHEEGQTELNNDKPYYIYHYKK